VQQHRHGQHLQQDLAIHRRRIILGVIVVALAVLLVIATKSASGGLLAFVV
jgi:hypothetical protein